MTPIGRISCTVAAREDEPVTLESHLRDAILSTLSTMQPLERTEVFCNTADARPFPDVFLVVWAAMIDDGSIVIDPDLEPTLTLSRWVEDDPDGVLPFVTREYAQKAILFADEVSQGVNLEKHLKEVCEEMRGMLRELKEEVAKLRR